MRLAASPMLFLHTTCSHPDTICLSQLLANMLPEQLFDLKKGRRHQKPENLRDTCPSNHQQYYPWSDPIASDGTVPLTNTHKLCYVLPCKIRSQKKLALQ
jgi:hypothetical protein